MLEEATDPTVVDLFPNGPDEQTQMLARCERLFNQSKAWRQSYEDNWKRFYKLSMSFMQRAEGDWGSIVFVPMVFTIIETIKARMSAQMPVPMVTPVGPEDTDGARHMESMLKWAAEQSDLYLELVKLIDSALRYGTGIMKVTPGKRSTTRTRREPVMEPIMQAQPVTDPDTGQPLMSPDGQLVTQDVQTGSQPGSRTQKITEEVVYYIGPFGECLDLFDVYVDPMATDFSNADYVIHRQWKSKAWFDAKVKSGFFRKPDYMSEYDFRVATDVASQQRLQSVNLAGSMTEPNSLEIREHWYSDGTVVYSCNQRVVVRVVETPFDHGEFPFVRIVDHLNPHEFYGVGEIHHLEGPQDLINALTNQRVDNVRLAMEKVFYGDARAITDRRDLKIAPGGYIGVNNPNDQPLDQVFRVLDMGDVPVSSYEEVQFWQSVVEYVSAVTPYQTGSDPQGTLNDTATGVALISEQGNTRFSMKLKIAELTGLKELFRQYGSLIQQFVPPDFVVRIIGPDGESLFNAVEPAALYGAFDYDIQAGSSAQTETIRKQQAIEVFNTALAAIDPQTGQSVFDLHALGEDLLRAEGKKDVQRYLAQPPAPPGPQGMGPGAMGPGDVGAMMPASVPPGPTPPNGNQGTPP